MTLIGFHRVRCPVCDKWFETHVVLSTNTVGGTDTDFFVRASGFSPVLFVAVTCPACLYSGYISDFDPTITLDDSTKQLLQSKLQRPEGLLIGEPYTVPGILDNAEHTVQDIHPPWVKQELVARTWRLLKRPDESIAYAYLYASWIVRELSNPLKTFDMKLQKTIYSALIDSITEQSNLPDAREASGQVAIARTLVEKVGTLKGDRKLQCSLAALCILRRHGENIEASAILDYLRPLLPDLQFREFADSLRASIECEEYYQRLALKYFKRVLDAQAQPWLDATVLYLCGELSRRLGNWRDALHYYTRAANSYNCSGDLASLIQQQSELVQEALNKQ